MEGLVSLALLTAMLPFIVTVVTIFIIIFLIVRLETINTHLKDIKEELKKQNNKIS